MEPTRDRLVNTAMRLFWEKGYGATSVSEILHAAEANSGSLYHFFPTKQDLLVAVLQAYQAGIAPMLLAPAWEGVSDPIEKVFALLGKYRELLIQTDCFYGCPIGSLALEIHEPDPEIRTLLADNFDGWAGHVERCLEEAGERLPAKLDRRALGQFILTVMEGGVMQSRTHRTIEAYDAGVAALRDYLTLLETAASAETVQARPVEGV